MNECSDTNLSNLLKTDKRLRNGETVFLGFVGFTSPDFAEKAMEEKEILVLKKPVKLTYARGSRQRGSQYFSKTRLHISGIGSLHEQELVEMLGNCDLIWPKDAKNAKKPYVFAQFQTEDEKKEAIDKLNGKKVDEENTLKLSPAYSQRFTQRPPIDRRRRFQG
ncbi:hypothetical protein VCUG_02155 [Vavraia culicis subsp. floridensis]|uniref:RRM domain-containing protein n=1 Tax=Vavraia culicis (isolate floridensis) TaxID=948595 RepID=L2GTB6_VAVCU|nr:uncharacterized protein VCUG_02155 [Vavraia culicis subsp. floridensis]ELA46350.1 hypothetical protein VCUG_02155 [Vavraia culicis subsp. floridensis]